jgi:hypothetical protein
MQDPEVNLKIQVRDLLSDLQGHSVNRGGQLGNNQTVTRLKAVSK